MDGILYPIKMHPANRGGALTPWGGNQVTEIYGKQSDANPLGESLEISCLPGLESRNDSGSTLTELIARYGEVMVGRYAGKPFPLLPGLLRRVKVQRVIDGVYFSLNIIKVNPYKQNNMAKGFGIDSTAA
ncbi:MAG: hypothetical protein Q4C54_06100 [Clostridia bacterium]|nr:hypothetical protein [Clostridia bacterium]